MRVLKVGDYVDLALEPLNAYCRSGVGRQHLDNNLPSQRGVFTEKDTRHSSAAELALEEAGCTEGVLQLLAKIGRWQSS